MMAASITLWTSSTTSLAESKVAGIIRATNGLAAMYDCISVNGCTSSEIAEKISDAFGKLVKMTMSDTTLHIVAIVPIYEEDAPCQVKNLVEACTNTSHKISLHVIALNSGIRKIFSAKDDGLDENKVKNQIEGLKADSINPAFSFSFSILDDYAANGAAIGFTVNSLSHYIALWQITLMQNYYSVLSPALLTNYPGQNISFGISSLRFDRDAAIQQLLGLGFLSALDHVGINKQQVNAQKAVNTAEGILNGINKRYADTYATQIQPLYKVQGLDQGAVVAKANGILQADIDLLSNGILDLLRSDELTFPEKEVILATILGRDNENIRGMQYDHETLILDDACSETIDLFVDSYNQCGTLNNNLPKRCDYKALKLFEWNEESGEMEENEAENRKAINPLDEIKKLKQDILNTTAFIRTKNDELKALQEEDASRENVDKIRQQWNRPAGVLTDIEYKEQPLDEKYIPTRGLQPKNSVDMRKFMSPVRNQMDLGSCTSFAVVAMYEALMNKVGVNGDNVMSPAYLYYYSNILNGRPAGGSNFFEQFEVIGKHGLCPESLYQYDAENPSNPPSAKAVEEANSHHVKTAKQIPLVNEEDKIKTLERNHKLLTSALSEGFPIGFSIKVYDNFGKDGAFILHPEETPDAKEDGYHAMVIVGYSEENNFYIVRNSWGAEFGEQGYCYIPFTYIDDPDYTNFACIITEITESVQGSVAEIPQIIADFAATESEIKMASIRNAISKSKIELKNYQKLYTEYYKYYQTLVQQLTTPSVQKNLRQGSQINQFLKVGDEQKKLNELNDSFVGKLKEFKKGLLQTIIGSVVITFVSLVAAYAFYKTDYETISVITALVLLVFSVLLILNYRWSKRQKRKELQDEVDEQTVKVAQMKKQLDETQIKFHVAGMWIAQFHTLSLKLENVYNRLVSFNNSLREWKKDYSDQVGRLRKSEGEMFRILDCSDQLKDFFEKNKNEIVGNVNLLDVFRDYTVNPAALDASHEQLRKKVADAISVLMGDFCMAEFLTGKSYPYASPINLQEEMKTLSAVGQPCCRNASVVESPSLLFMVNVDPNMEERWKSQVFTHLSPQPSLLKIEDRTTIVLMAIHPVAI